MTEILLVQYGQCASGSVSGSVQALGPLVQPGAPTSPFAFDQPASAPRPVDPGRAEAIADRRERLRGLLHRGLVRLGWRLDRVDRVVAGQQLWLDGRAT